MQMIKFGEETRLAGIKISEGVAVARVCLFNEDRHANIPIYKVNKSERKKEKGRLIQAIQIGADQLSRVIVDVKKRIGDAESKIFIAQKMILEDTSIHDEMFDDIENEGANAEAAVIRVLDSYETRLLDVDNEYIKARATDIGEIKRRLLDILSEVTPSFLCTGIAQCQRGKNRIIVARELTPSLTVGLEKQQIVGFVTEHGGISSHAAILARAMGIPAVSGIQNIHSMVSCGTEILLNGNEGNVIIWPSQKTIAQYKSGKVYIPKGLYAVDPVDGMKVMANISRHQDIEEAVIVKAEGVGLYRTEFEFLAQGEILSEDEQFKRYKTVVMAMKGQPVYFRLIDVGGDKTADFLDLPAEINPALGFRGSRLLVARNELLAPQARALVRASEFGPVWVLYPMIVDLEQFLIMKQRFLEETADLNPGEIKHGVMFEVPSACLEAKKILKHADFASIGTNDLIQYLYAVDRDNEYVAYDYNPDKEALWNLITLIAKAAKDENRPLSVCGEIAGNKKYIIRLKEIGITRISVGIRQIPELRMGLK
ncbi:MAG: phosphoenolpyruvate--protein phosphotransferase [Spirochaetales bacterium]|nr:phosphoenolpyruvate--protein phosphotransferase [Spirochaetales bacterium]